MVWKPKEKDLTPDEAVALAKRELLQFWYGSSPLLAAVRGPDGKVAAHPLSRELQTKRWLLLFAEPASIAGDGAIRCLGEYHARYSTLDVGVVLVLSGGYSFLREREIVENILKTLDVECIVCTDMDRLLAEAFRVERFPKIVLLEKGQVALEQEGFEDPSLFEGEVQKLLRRGDPGLPLLPVFTPEKIVRDMGRIDFGQGFTFKAGTLELHGKWVQKEDRLETRDAHAELVFIAPMPGVAVAASSPLRTVPARIRVTVDDSPVRSQNAGLDLGVDDEGQSTIEASIPRAYRALKALTPGMKVTMTFPYADRGGAIVYGLRFSQ